MRLDNLKTFCRTQYGTSTERFDKEIAAYRFENARVDVDEETVKAIKDACQIPQATAIASTQVLPDERVEMLINGYKQIVQVVNAHVQVVNAQVKAMNAQDQTIKRLETEMVLLKTTAGEVTASLIQQVEELKETTIPIAPVAPVAPAVPAQFAGFESVFG